MEHDLFDDPGHEPDIDYDTPANMPEGEAEALERASWHMRKAAMLKAERDQLNAVYQAEIDRLLVRRGHRLRIIDNQIEWHEEPVRSLHLALLRDNPRRKTIELPYGTSKVRAAQKPKVIIEDKGAVLAWAERNHPDLLGMTINVTDLRSVAEPTDDGRAVDAATGELVPGASSHTPEPTWSALYEQDES